MIRLTNAPEVRQQFQQTAQQQEQAMLRTLAYVGETAVRTARAEGSYTDRTSNLRNSTGYVIVHRGRIIQTTATGDTAEGRKAAGATLRELAARHISDTALIVCAGMHYAEYVQARGYDVLTSAEIVARDLAERLLKQWQPSRVS